MPVGLLLDSMTSLELSEWIAYYRVEAQDEEEAIRKAEQQAKNKKR